MQDDVILNKAAVVRRCLQRVREEYRDDPERLKNVTAQDSIDLAMHIVARKRLGIAQDARHAFDLLQSADLLDEPLAQRMKAMVGFRNIAVHDYQALNLDILQKIITLHLSDLETYLARVLEMA